VVVHHLVEHQEFSFLFQEGIVLVSDHVDQDGLGQELFTVFVLLGIQLEQQLGRLIAAGLQTAPGGLLVEGQSIGALLEVLGKGSFAQAEFVEVGQGLALHETFGLALAQFGVCYSVFQILFVVLVVKHECTLFERPLEDAVVEELAAFHRVHALEVRVLFGVVAVVSRIPCTHVDVLGHLEPQVVFFVLGVLLGEHALAVGQVFVLNVEVLVGLNEVVLGGRDTLCDILIIFYVYFFQRLVMYMSPIVSFVTIHVFFLL